MKPRKPLFFLFGLLSSLMVTGCVTERTYSGTDIPVAEKKIDKIAAARQRTQLGLTYLRRGNSVQAKYNLDLALDFAPELESVHLAIAYYYLTVGELELTEQAYRRAINSRQASGDAFNNFGVFLCQQGQFAESEKMLLEAVKRPKYSRSASSYENLGICSRKAGKFDKARQYLERALQYEPRRRSALMELTDIELEQGLFLAAKQALLRYHRVAVESPESLALGIKIEQGLKDEGAAKHFGILLLAKFPSSEQAKNYRANMQ